MELSKSLLSAGVITAVAAGSFAGVSAVNAHGGNGEVRQELIDRIAEDTGADPATVEASFEAIREERRAEREAARAEYLDSLVADGTLTQEQRDALEAKKDEMKAAKEALKDQDLSHEEIRAMMQEARDEFKAWAEKQGINLEDIKPERGEGFGRHGHHHFHMNDDSDSPSEEL